MLWAGVLAISLLSADVTFTALSVTVLKCSLKVSLLSSVTPRYLTAFLARTTASPTRKGHKVLMGISMRRIPS